MDLFPLSLKRLTEGVKIDDDFSFQEDFGVLIFNKK